MGLYELYSLGVWAPNQVVDEKYIEKRNDPEFFKGYAFYTTECLRDVDIKRQYHPRNHPGRTFKQFFLRPREYQALVFLWTRLQNPQQIMLVDSYFSSLDMSSGVRNISIYEPWLHQMYAILDKIQNYQHYITGPWNFFISFNNFVTPCRSLR